MTQPSPTPTTGAGPGGLTLVAPSTTGSSGSSGADKYGLGVWGSQTVNPGDLPFLTGILSTSGNTTGDSILKAFLSAPSDQVATVQHALYMAGYYPKSFTPKWGVITSEDRNAFGNAITLAGQAGAPVSQLLESQASYGAQAGIEAAQANITASTAKTATVNLPNATDLEALALKAFQNALGRKATPKEAAQFAASYRAMSAGVQRAGNQAVYDAQVGAVSPSSPLANVDAGQLVQAATTNPQANNPNLSPRLAHELGTGGNPNSTPPASFNQQVGGLMNLGQQVAVASAPGSAQQGGLTQVNVESPISPDVAAQNYARNTYPNQAAATDLANTFNQFLALLAGNGLGG